MMSKRTNLIIVGVIVIAMIGIPVFSAVKMALQGSGSVESQMDKGIAQNKSQLPVAMDEYITLTDIERDGRDFIYDYEVKVSPEKLLEMESYFRRKAQFDYCNSLRILTFKTQNIRTVVRFKAEASEQASFEIITTATPCDDVKGTGAASIRMSDTIEESFLETQYLSFFLPAELTDSLTIVSLMPPPHFTLEHTALRENLIDLGDVLGPEI